MITFENLNITPEILAAISEIDEFKGAWRALGTLSPDRLVELRRVATIESIGSSTRIEGSKLSDRDVEKLLGKIHVHKFATRDEQEVAGYAETMELIFRAWKDIPISENHIRQLHRDLLKHSEKDERHRGNYKTLRNDVGAFDASGKMVGVVFETATPFDTPKHMKDLVAWFHNACALQNPHPLIIIAIFIVTFLAIHPFQDGNGRLSRILTTLLLLQAGYVYVPYASLESIVESRKEDYYLSLRKTQETLKSKAPKWTPWVTFFLQTLQAQKRHLATKIEREHKAIKDLPELAIYIIDYVKEHGRVTRRDMVRAKGASPNTLKSILSVLVKKGYLVKNGGGRSTWYGFPH